jgi:regulator of telomere elongation helicase 1
MKAVRGNEGNNGRGGEQAQAAAAHQKRQRSNKALASSPPTTLELRGIRVQFPFRPYACQETYMEKVLDALLKSENALLESPTGTGKTLCLLCAALAWQRQQKFSLDAIGGDATMTLQQQSRTSTALTTMSQTPAMAAPAAQRRSRNRTPTIIYASRTHSQLSQVVRELRNTVYRPKHAVLASREQMCVHPKVKKEQHSASDVNYHCNQLCKERKCKFRNNLEGFTAPDCGETAVSAGVGAGVADYHCDNSHHTQPVRDMEDLIAMGKSLSICPFYYTRGQLETAELVLVPYNYLFDKEARQTTLKDVPWDNAIVIFDEAHNLESFASDSASFDLTNADLAGCVLELDRALNYLQSFGAAAAGGGEHSIKPDNVLTLKDIVLRLEKFILNLSDQQTTYSGEFMMEVFQRGGGINHANKGFLLQELRTVTEFIMEIRSAGSGGGRNSSSNGTGCPKIEHFVDCVKRVFNHELESRCIAKASYYRVVSSSFETASIRYFILVSYKLTFLVQTTLFSMFLQKYPKHNRKRRRRLQQTWEEPFRIGVLLQPWPWKNSPISIFDPL